MHTDRRMPRRPTSYWLAADTYNTGPTPGGDSPTPTTDFAFIRRCICTGFCSPDLADFRHLYISSDEKLFNKILTCPNNILPFLRTLLPQPTAQNYSFRNRAHNRQLLDRISRITDCNCTVRMLYRNMYRLLYILDLRFVLFLCTTAVWQFAINEYVMLCYNSRTAVCAIWTFPSVSTCSEMSAVSGSR